MTIAFGVFICWAALLLLIGVVVTVFMAVEVIEDILDGNL